MKNILAIDTTSNLASVNVSVLDNNNILYSAYNENNKLTTHSEKLFPLIDKSLKETNLNITDIDEYLVCNGPGSFTGTRIGVTTIKGLTITNDKPIYAFSSLEAMAFNLYNKLNNDDLLYVSIINAKGLRVYYAIYEFKNNTTNILTIPSASTITDLLDILKKDYSHKNIIFSTDTTEEYITIINNYNEYNNTSFKLFNDNIYVTGNILIKYYTYIKNKENYKKNTYDLDVEYVRSSSAERIKNGTVSKKS